MVEPIKVDIRTVLNPPSGAAAGDDGEEGAIDTRNSDLRQGYLSITQILNMVSDQNHLPRLQYKEYTHGTTVFAVELGKCGMKQSEHGSMDLEV